MADEALLIGQPPAEPPKLQPQGGSGIETPREFVNVSVFGVFKQNFQKDPNSTEEEYVEQPYRIQRPKGTTDEDTAQFVWSAKFLPQAALRAVGSAGEVNFYPLDMFKRFAVNVSSVVGVTV